MKNKTISAQSKLLRMVFAGLLSCDLYEAVLYRFDDLYVFQPLHLTNTGSPERYLLFLFTIAVTYPVIVLFYQKLLKIHHYIVAMVLYASLSLISNLSETLLPKEWNPFHILFLVVAILCYLYKHKEFEQLIAFLEPKDTIHSILTNFAIYLLAMMTYAFNIGLMYAFFDTKPERFKTFNIWVPLISALILTVCFIFAKEIIKSVLRTDEIRRLHTQILKEKENVSMAQQKIIASQEEVITSFSNILETKSGESGGHVKRVGLYSETLALTLGLSAEEAHAIRIASLMHDVGKILIPNNILEKPGKFTNEEYAIMKKHVLYGEEILATSEGDIMKLAGIIASEHHERWDGKGYMKGLKGDEIALAAQIVSVADVFDALTSKRCYKEPWTIQEAYVEIICQSGHQFSPRVVQAFISCFPKIKEIKDVLDPDRLASA